VISLAREGYPFVLGALSVAAILAIAGAVRGGPLIWATAVVALLCSLAFAFFFRDPNPPGPRNPHLLLAPAYGRIAQIREVDEPLVLQGRAIRVSIFLSIFNVHVQRAPIGGQVVHRSYKPGSFLVAWRDAASESNEQAALGIDTGTDRVLVRQIAGVIARRIHTYPEQGDTVEQGQRIGLIRFGSRVDTFLPPDWTVKVRVGESVKAAVSVLAEDTGIGAKRRSAKGSGGG